MKVAIATDAGQVSAHFGRCEGYTLYEVGDGKVEPAGFIPAPRGHAPGELPQLLHQAGADVIIAGGMGVMAKQLFNEAGLEVVIGAAGDVAAAAQAYAEGKLQSTGAPCDHEH